ncbi:MAG: thiol:disulfide interchange protein DsbA/DsbL [Dokdonella sp.]
MRMHSSFPHGGILLAGCLIAGLLSAPLAFAADGTTAKWQAGEAYQLIDPPVPTVNGNKIEVLEVFSYACPHCAHFQPYADKLKAGLPAKAEFSLLPADFQERWVMFARGFYAAQALGLVDKTHQALFDAIWRDNRPINSLDQLADFYAENGADKNSFLSTAQSFVVEGDLAQVRQKEAAYGVDSTPTLIIDGKYRVTADSAKKIGFEEMVQIAQYLIAQEAKKKH